MRVKSNVTEEDIRLGEPTSTTSCPISLCLYRELRKRGILVREVFTRDEQIRVLVLDVEGWTSVYEAKTPDDLKEFIDAFDNDMDVKLVEFSLNFRKVI
jgi:hypothetical protein